MAILGDADDFPALILGRCSHWRVVALAWVYMVTHSGCPSFVRQILIVMPVVRRW
jgi:hypothetical protein